MRVSVCTCVSTAADLLESCINSLMVNAGITDFDLIVVTWNASPDVLAWLHDNRWVHHEVYETNPDVGYVPNVRGEINKTFDAGFAMNDFCVRTDADVVFGRNWLKELVQWADEDVIVSPQHITPIKGPHVITADLGTIASPDFDALEFLRLVDKHRRPGELQTEDQRGGWLNTLTMPYVMHRKWWEACGPWELTGIGKRIDPPDRRFFTRCHEAGAKFSMAMGSVVYHQEGAERKRKTRPAGAEAMPEEGVNHAQSS